MGVLRKKVLCCVISTAVLLHMGMAIEIFAITKSMNELHVIGTVTYTNNSQSANLIIDTSRVDLHKYEIKQIIGPEGESLSLTKPVISVNKNATYMIKIKYIEKLNMSNEDTKFGNGAIYGRVGFQSMEPIKEIKDIRTLEIPFVVDGIKSSEVNDIKKANSKINSPSDRKLRNQNKRTENMINFNNDFYISAYATNNPSSLGTNISNIVKRTENGNTIQTTIKGQGAYQGVSFTSKNKVDFTRDFIISGTSTQPITGAEGFLFAFHNTPGYMYRGGWSSNLGFYNYNNSGFKGDALVLEADAYNNSGVSGENIFGDFAKYGSSYAHLQALFMNKTATTHPTKGYFTSVSINDIAGTHHFEIIWKVETKEICFNVDGRKTSIGLEPVWRLGSNELYYTIGVSTGGNGLNSAGYDSYLTYDGISYTTSPSVNFDGQAETTYTRKNDIGEDVKIPYESLLDLKNYAKPGDIVHVTHKLTNEHKDGFADIVEKVSIPKSLLGKNELSPIDGTLKTYTDRDKTKIDIKEKLFHGESTDITFMKKSEGAAYIEYDIKLPDKILDNVDISSMITIGKPGMTQHNFESNAKVAGNPTLHIKDLDVILDKNTEYISEQEMKRELTGHTFDTTNDLDLIVTQPNLELTYTISDMQNNTLTLIPKNIPGIYIVQYTLKDTRDSQLTTMGKRVIYVSDKHVKENGIAIVAQNFTINELDLREHKTDILDLIKKESLVKAYAVDKEVEINDITVDLQGFAYTSLAKDSPYIIKLIAEKDGKKASIEIGITLTPNVLGFLEIPSNVNLYDTGGIDQDHAGANVDIKLKNHIISNVIYDVKADTGFDISNAQGESYVVNLYDNKKMLYKKDSEGKALLGSIDDENRNKQVWYNIVKDSTRDTSKYEGNMTFYLSVKKKEATK